MPKFNLSYIRKTYAFMACYFFAHIAFSQSGEKLPLNSAVKYGKLPNGLQYYILENDDTSDKIEIKLTVNAGNFDEAQNENGVAHFVEHLGVRSTSHFPHGVSKFFSARGARCIASTGGTTDYSFTIPDHANLLDSAMLALSDCAGRISFLPAEIEQERAAVLRELEGGNNKAFRSLKQIPFLQLDRNPYYAYPVRQIEIVKTTSGETLVDFYKDWYHPMYQTVFVVGNVDATQVEKLIKQYFSGFSNNGAKQKANLKTLLDVPLHAKNKLVVVEQGREIQSIKVELFKKRKPVYRKFVIGTQDEIKVELCYTLVNAMLDQRLKNLREGNAFLPEAISIDQRAIAPSANIEAITTHQVVSKSSNIKQAIQSAAVESKRLEKFGFSESEISRAKGTILSALKGLQKNPQGNNQLLYSLRSYHDEGSAFPLDESSLRIKLLGSLTAKEINATVIQWLRTKGNIDIVLSVPDMNDPEVPTETEAFAWLNEASRQKTVKYEEPKLKSLPNPPAINAGSKYSIQELPELDAIRMELENGAVVIIKPLAKDEGTGEKIEVQGFNRYSAQRLKHVQGEITVLKDVKLFTGVASLNAKELQHLKAERKVSVLPFIDEGNIKIIGSSKSKDAEVLFHLINLYMASAKPDDEAFKRYCTLHSPESSIKVRLPGEVFEDTINSVTGRSGSMEKPVVSYSKERMKQFFKLYNENFTDPSEFIFIITGTFDKQRIIQLVNQYLGVLSRPDYSQQETNITNYASASSIAGRFIPGAQITFESDSAKNGLVCVLFEGKNPINVKDKLALEVANVALKKLFFERLREKEKGVYGVSNNIWINKSAQNFFLDVRFDSSPSDVQRLAVATKDELQLLATTGLSETLFVNSKAKIRDNLIWEINSSMFWRPFLLKCEQNENFSATDELNKVEIFDSLKPSDVSNAVQKYLNLNDYMIIKLLN